MLGVLTSSPDSALGFQKGAALEFLERLAELLLGVHDDGAVPGHGLRDGFARYQEEADAVFARPHGQFVTTVEKHERAIVGGRVPQLSPPPSRTCRVRVPGRPPAHQTFSSRIVL